MLSQRFSCIDTAKPLRSSGGAWLAPLLLETRKLLVSVEGRERGSLNACLKFWVALGMFAPDQ